MKTKENEHDKLYFDAHCVKNTCNINLYYAKSSLPFFAGFDSLFVQQDITFHGYLMVKL